jgi:hypothetical protein
MLYVLFFCFTFIFSTQTATAETESDIGWDNASVYVSIAFYDDNGHHITLSIPEAELLLQNEYREDVTLYDLYGRIAGGENELVIVYPENPNEPPYVVSAYTTIYLNTKKLKANWLYTIEMPEHAVGSTNCRDEEGGGMEKCSVRMSGSIVFMLNNNGKIVKLLDDDLPFEESNIHSFVDESKLLSTRLGVTKYVDTAMNTWLSTIVRWLGEIAEGLLKWTMNSIETLLDTTQNIVLSSGAEGAWTNIRNLSLSLLLAVIIIIAFANVLQIDLETHGINRIIPKVVVAIILVMTSWVIFQFFFEFTLILHKQALAITGINNNSSGGLLDILGGINITSSTTGDIFGKLGSVLLLILIMGSVAICGIILLFSLIIRVFILSLLLITAPLVFILGILPFAQSLQKDWWKNFFKWMFMAPIAVLIISIGMVIAFQTGLRSGQLFDDTTVTSSGSMLIGLLILAGSLYFAATLPLKWSGDFKAVMEGWQKFGLGASKIANNKFGGGFLARKSPTASMFTKEHWANRSARLKDAQKLEFNRSQQELANKKWFGQTLVGASDMQLSGMDSSVKQGYKKEAANMSIGQLGNRLKNAKNLMEFQALVETAQEKHGGAEKLWANDGDLDEFGDWTSSAVADKATRAAAQDNSLYESLKDADFKTYMAKENLGLTARSAISNDNSDLLKNLEKGESKKAIYERDAGFINALNDYGTSGREAASIGDGTRGTIDEISKIAYDRYTDETRNPTIRKKFETDAKVKLKASYKALEERRQRLP